MQFAGRSSRIFVVALSVHAMYRGAQKDNNCAKFIKSENQRGARWQLAAGCLLETGLGAILEPLGRPGEGQWEPTGNRKSYQNLIKI